MTIAIVLDRPGGKPLDLVGAGWNAVRYSTVVGGGFGALTLVAPADARRIVPSLGIIRVTNDDRIVWEGLAEDVEFGWDTSLQATTVTFFGRQRLLQLAGTAKFWELRSFPLNPTLPAAILQSPNLYVSTGFVDFGNTTLRGIRVQGQNVLVNSGVDFGGGSIQLPVTGSAKALLGSTYLPGGGGGFTNSIQAFDSSGAFTGSFATPGAAVDWTLDLSRDTTAVTVALWGTVTTTAVYAPTSDTAFVNLRLLGQSVVEDAPGGFYAATLLRDVLSGVPGITIGQIDNATEYLIQELDRSSSPSNVLSVVNEIAAYFTREWFVWDEGRFDWRQPNLSEPGWTITLADTISGRIKQTVDGLARDTWVSYVDVTDQRQKLAIAQTTRIGNAFYRNGLKSDDIQSPGLAFTPTSAAAFAQAANFRNSRIPAAQGTIVVAAWKLLSRSNGSTVPALEIRAGDNVSVPDFATDDAFSAGQDNASLFHILQTDVDLSAATVTLTIAGYLPGLDVLTARLNAVTKVATS